MGKEMLLTYKAMDIKAHFERIGQYLRFLINDTKMPEEERSRCYNAWTVEVELLAAILNKLKEALMANNAEEIGGKSADIVALIGSSLEDLERMKAIVNEAHAAERGGEAILN